jgi:hypothetical protein
MATKDDALEQSQALNQLLLEMTRTQKTQQRALIKVYIVTVVCFTALLISMIIGFFWYESQFETTTQTTEKIVTQEVSGTDSEINNVEENLYKDNAVHNDERGDN